MTETMMRSWWMLAMRDVAFHATVTGVLMLALAWRVRSWVRRNGEPGSPAAAS